ncbi:MAG: exonuclease domain-containing protein [Oscillospiraceae bacterium]|nr:exonuclease domain-containing protein [Oscillospiraceae bacterium]
MRTDSDIIILDLEWNQPLGKKNMVTDPVPLMGEIIRVGAVKADREYNVKDKLNLYVRPRFYKKINYAVGRVTGLSGADITYGLPFPEVYKRLLSFCGDDPLIFTWGTEDEKIVKQNLAVHRMNNELPEFCDLQVFFSRRVLPKPEQYSVTAALEHYGLEAELKAHDALNDAIYTYRVARKMDIYSLLPQYEDILREIEEEREQKRLERYCRTYPGIELESPEDLPQVRRVCMCKCPDCRSRMRRSVIERVSDTMFAAEAVCEKCGTFRVEFELAETGAADGENGLPLYDVTRRYTKLSETGEQP